MSNDIILDTAATSAAAAKARPDAPIANALREAGFIPLPRLWVKREDMAQIHALAERYRREVNTIRGTVRETNPDLDDHYQPKCSDPKLDKNAAWQQFEKMQASKYAGK